MPYEPHGCARLLAESQDGPGVQGGVAPGRPHSRFIDTAAARMAVALAQPSIERALVQPAVSALNVLHIVVLDPSTFFGSCRFEEAILYEHSIGDRAQWDADYAAFARAKAALSWRHGADSRTVAQLRPHCLSQGETLLGGGVSLDGMVVAASGAVAQWDEAFALQVAGYLRAIALERSLGQAVLAHPDAGDG